MQHPSSFIPTEENAVCVGKIMTAHGIKGEVRIYAYTAQPETVLSFPFLYDTKGTAYVCNKGRVKDKSILIVFIEGVETRNQAEALSGITLWVPRTQLPNTDEDEYYYVDMIGLQALLRDGTPFGTVVAVHNFGSEDMLEIALETTKKTEFFPFTKAVIPEIYLAKGHLIIVPPETISERE